MGPFRRGFKAVADGDWLAAHDAFEAAAQQDVRASAMLALCAFKLGERHELVMNHLKEEASPVQHLVRALVIDKGLGNLDPMLRRRKLAQVRTVPTLA